MFTTGLAGPLSRGGFRSTWVRARERADLPAFRFHLLRHTGNSLVLYLPPLVLRQIVRAAAGSSTGWEEFAQRLYRQGVHLRARMSERNPG